MTIMLNRIISMKLRHRVRKFSSISVDVSELEHFKRFSQEWWNESGQFGPLHSMNKLRVPLIRNGLISMNPTSQVNVNCPTPLKGLSILDVGCGGGILSEPLARIGGAVTGLDATYDLIEQAKAHAKAENIENIHYICSSIEDHAKANKNKYDAVVASEVVEHVTEKETFLKACVQCLRPGGSIFLTTINKTCLANFITILVAENVLQVIPKGTHQYDKLIQPHKLRRILEEENCRTILIHGMIYNFLTSEWLWSQSSDISYALHAVKSSSA